MSARSANHLITSKLGGGEGEKGKGEKGRVSVSVGEFVCMFESGRQRGRER